MILFFQRFWKFYPSSLETPHAEDFLHNKACFYGFGEFYMSRRSLLGSSTTSLMRRKKKTASLPSMSLWSYVRAMYIIGLGTTLPPTTTARDTIECIPKIADCKQISEYSVFLSTTGIKRVSKKVKVTVTVTVSSSL